MTTPALSMDSPYGRLYTTPGIGTPSNVAKADTWRLVETGVLSPSVTNVLGVADKPFLKTWAARLAAESAVGLANQYPDDLATRPKEAAKWAAAEHVRRVNQAAELGDLVHNACERLSLGQPAGDLPDQALPYLRAWEQFVDDFDPEFVKVESTVFGNTPEGYGYAGTADFIAKIGGEMFVGDYKTGRGIYDSAALQLSALSNAARIVDDTGENLQPHTPTERGIIVHLTPKGYKVRPVDTTPHGEGWAAFGAYRQAWQFHARSLAARNPLLLQPAVTSRSELAAQTSILQGVNS